MKLGQATLEQLQSEVDWEAPDARSQAEAVLRGRAFEYAKAYLEGGASALGVYRDKTQATYIAKEFEVLLAQSPCILEYRPELTATSSTTPRWASTVRLTSSQTAIETYYRQR